MFLYTPPSEHFGIVPVEAMCCGTPVVAVNNGGPTESIRHQTTGFLADPTPEAFAEGVLYCLQNADRLSAAGVCNALREGAQGPRGRHRPCVRARHCRPTGGVQGHSQVQMRRWGTGGLFLRTQMERPLDRLLLTHRRRLPANCWRFGANCRWSMTEFCSTSTDSYRRLPVHCDVVSGNGKWCVSPGKRRRRLAGRGQSTAAPRARHCPVRRTATTLLPRGRSGGAGQSCVPMGCANKWPGTWTPPS